MRQDRTDEQLVEMFTTPALWLVRGGEAGLLAQGPNLQSALTAAFDQSRAGKMVQAIVKMPDDEIVIGVDQIQRLWKHFSLVANPEGERIPLG